MSTKQHREELKYFLERFLDIAEAHMPDYSSSDFIAEANDTLRDIEDMDTYTTYVLPLAKELKRWLPWDEFDLIDDTVSAIMETNQWFINHIEKKYASIEWGYCEVDFPERLDDFISYLELWTNT